MLTEILSPGGGKQKKGAWESPRSARSSVFRTPGRGRNGSACMCTLLGTAVLCLQLPTARLTCMPQGT